jgi:hypothetical protein
MVDINWWLMLVTYAYVQAFFILITLIIKKEGRDGKF